MDLWKYLVEFYWNAHLNATSLRHVRNICSNARVEAIDMMSGCSPCKEEEKRGRERMRIVMFAFSILFRLYVIMFEHHNKYNKIIIITLQWMRRYRFFPTYIFSLYTPNLCSWWKKNKHIFDMLSSHHDNRTLEVLIPAKSIIVLKVSVLNA